MAQGHATKSYVSNAVNVAAGTTKQTVCAFGINTEMRLNCKIDVILGKCSVAGTTTVGLQDTNGLGLWSDTKTGAVSSSTDKTVTVTANTGTLTSANHGYTNGQLVTINSTGTVPGGLLPGAKYYVANATTNTFQLTPVQQNGAPIATFSDAGSGTIKTTAATVLTLVFNAQTAGDVQYLPLRPQARLVCTTDVSDTVQVIDVRVAHLY